MRGNSLVICTAFLTLTWGGLSACSGLDSASGPASADSEAVAQVILSPDAADVTVGGTVALTVSPRNASGRPLRSGPEVFWSSSDTLVARVSSVGEVTAVGEGTATLTATSGKSSGKSVVTVRGNKHTIARTVQTVVVSPNPATVAVGQTATATASPRDSTGAAIDGRLVVWSSSAPAVATVSASGVVTGVAAGTTSIVATVDGIPGSTPLTVTAPAEATPAPAPAPVPAPVASVTISAPSTSVSVGGSLQLGATLKSADGAVLTGRAVTWSSSAPAVMTVSSTGVVAAVAAGSATVTATSEGRSASVGLTAIAVPAPVSGIAVYPGESIQAKVNANPTGTTFIIKAGTHTGQSVIPKSGDRFIGEAGAVLDGQNATAYAFYTGGAPYPANVTIYGLKITRYAPPAQMGAITAGGHTRSEGSTGWVIDSNYVTGNANLGIRIGHRARVTRNVVTYNGTLGVGGVADSALVEANEIAYNNASGANPDFEAGGTKFVLTRDLVVRGNFVHHNRGPGLWTDIDNVGAVYEGNLVEDNTREGIVHEISYRAVIRGNTVRRNGVGDRPGWLWGAGIGVHASADVEIYGNVLEGNGNGIAGIQQARGSGSIGAYVLRGMYVHDNTITQPTGAAAGLVDDSGALTVFSTTAGNRFDRNRYIVPSTNPQPFAWANAFRGWTSWRGYGLDATGTLN